MTIIHAIVTVILAIHPAHINLHEHHVHHVPKPVAIYTPAPIVTPKTTHIYSSDSFDRLAQCESGGNAATNTGNGFYGAFQFDLTTWHSLGNMGIPSEYSYATQKAAAEKLQRERGWTPWPACSARLGL